MRCKPFVLRRSDGPGLEKKEYGISSLTALAFLSFLALRASPPLSHLNIFVFDSFVWERRGGLSQSFEGID